MERKYVSTITGEIISTQQALENIENKRRELIAEPAEETLREIFGKLNYSEMIQLIGENKLLQEKLMKTTYNKAEDIFFAEYERFDK